MRKSFVKFFLSAFGLGFLPWTPGTWGSLGGLVLVYFISSVPVVDLIVFFILLLVTVTFLTRYFKMMQEKEKDPQFVVMDEVLGILVTFLSLPITWITALIGFVLFRFFDIVKPFGIRRLEKIEGAWGVILDDLVAGLFAHIILTAYIWSGAPVW